MEKDIDPMILYVLMRTDVPDYVAGKAMAQAHHAGTQFIGRAIQRAGKDKGFEDHFLEWYGEARGFGTCIVLGVTYPQLLSRVSVAYHLGLVADIVTDPTYPIRDGHRMHTLPIDTCGYLFGRKSRCSLVTEGLSLFS